jgi:ABC-2 type transport system permease protein
MNSDTWRQLSSLGRRSITRTLRQPRIFMAPVITPLALFLLIGSGLSRAESIPGFPADSYLAFMFAFPFIQGITLAAAFTGTDLARDLQTGFFRRMLLTPVSGLTLLMGHFMGVLIMGAIQITIYLIVGVGLAGIEIKSGLGGVLVIYILDLLIMLGLSSLVAYMALRTGSGEAVQGLFPLLLGTIFLSSMNMPRELITTDWYRTIVTYNPMSYLIEGLRSLIITGWDAQALGLAFGIAILQLMLTLSLATRAVRQKIAQG